MQRQCSTTTRQECSTTVEQQCSPTTRQECSTTMQRECNPTTRQECSTTMQRECSPTTRQECSTTMQQECSETTRQECSTTMQQECSATTRQECSTTMQQVSQSLEGELFCRNSDLVAGVLQPAKTELQESSTSVLQDNLPDHVWWRCWGLGRSAQAEENHWSYQELPGWYFW